MKTEPDVFSFEDLIQCKNRTDAWQGVRNYQARNLMRDDFKLGDKVLIYHSSTTPPGVAGLAEVVKEAYLDASASDPKSQYYDPKSKNKPHSWVCVDVKATHRLKSFVSLSKIRDHPKLASMLVIKRGQRLSIQPVLEKEWDVIVSLGEPIFI